MLGHSAKRLFDVVKIVVGSEHEICRKFDGKIFHGLKPVVIINAMLKVIGNRCVKIEGLSFAETDVAVEIKIIRGIGRGKPVFIQGGDNFMGIYHPLPVKRGK